MPDAAELVRDAWCAALRPQRRLSVTDWAEREVYLDESSRPGKFRARLTPYLREIMDCLSLESTVQDVVFMKGAQVGGSVAAANWIGYLIDNDRGSILIVEPTREMAQKFSKMRIAPMIQASPALRARVRDPRSRDSNNTILQKDFPGGSLVMVGANSAAGLRAISAKSLVLDEVDAFPASLPEEGDPVALAERATRTFPRSKRLYISTPTIAGRSRISKLWDLSDRRRYFVPCPHCGVMQVLVMRDAKTGRQGLCWEGGLPVVGAVWYQCQACDARIDESRKGGMLEHGEWRPEEPALSDKFRGYHISTLYAPPGTTTWRKMVERFLEAKGNTELLRVFVNQWLGELWEERGEAPPWEQLYRRREKYPIGQVPAGAVVLTAGADVQRDRIEVAVIGWGPGMESWNVDYVVLPGDVADPKVWTELDRLLMKPFRHAGGLDLRIRAMAVDSGFATQEVYGWTRKHPADQVFAVKGNDSAPVLVGQPAYVDVGRSGRRIARGLRLWHLGVSVAKRELYAWLRLEAPLHPEAGEVHPPGFVHFPEFGEPWFKQLVSEKLVARRDRRGFLSYQWEKGQERNEVLDAFLYGRGAAAIVGIDRWTPDDWSRAAAALRPEVTAAPRESGPRKKRPRDGGYFDRWRGPKPTR